MPLSALFSPLKRQFIWFATTFVVASLAVFSLLQLFPETQKTTIYFSLKPLQTESQTPTFDHAESTMKMAEAMAGWAKNPQFREDVAKEANMVIANFKRKLSARKQNYINVFWTLKLQNTEIAERDKVVAALINQIEARFVALNTNSRAPYAMTKPEIFSEMQTLPRWALIVFSLLLGIGLATVVAYTKEMIGGRLSFAPHLKAIFPNSPILSIPEKLGKHDEKLLEQFILTFDSPRLIGTFPASEKHFSLSPTDSINLSSDTPVLLVKLGETTVNELQNMEAIFGSNVAIIVFNQ